MQRAGNVSQVGFLILQQRLVAGQAPSQEQEEDGGSGAQGCWWDRDTWLVLWCPGGSVAPQVFQQCSCALGQARLRWQCPGLRAEVAKCPGSGGNAAPQVFQHGSRALGQDGGAGRTERVPFQQQAPANRD